MTLKVDYSVILGQCGGDKDLVREVIDILSREAPLYIEKIIQALADGEFHVIAETAHALKGAVVNFGVQEVSDSVLALETAARSEDRDVIAVRIDEVKEQVEELLKLLRDAPASYEGISA